MKAIHPVFALSLVAFPAAWAAPPATGSGAGQAVSQTCDDTGDHSQYCHWNGSWGTDGRECDIDVESIDRDACDFDASTASESAMANHAPICISSGKHEHIVFTSGQGRQYRIRRLIPFPDNGANCPDQPFGAKFDPKNFTFGATVDTKAAGSGAVGCFYKLEVQFMTDDANGPPDPNSNPPGRKLECRDPHLGIN